MHPDMTWCILSRDEDFVEDMEGLLLSLGAQVYAAATWGEYARLQAAGVVMEMLVVDPVYRLAGALD